MEVSYTIDAGPMRSGLVRFRAVYTGCRPKTSLKLPALLAKTGAAVEGLCAARPDGKRLRVKVSGETILIDAPRFTLEYSLRLTLKGSVGTDRETDLLYPFLNSSELFLATGTLPYPENLPAIANSLHAELRLVGLPAGWGVFSSLPEGPVCPAALDSFFLYCSKRPAAHTHIYKGVAGRIMFGLMVQKGKTIPHRQAEIWRFADRALAELEKSLIPLIGDRRINILVLQPPRDFERIARGGTFAAGENLLGGIAVYTPKSPAYIRQRYGYGSYAYHLRDGLTHELTHLYSTTAWQGRFKSLLFPSAGCPPRHKQLIGETLTAYFHEAVLRCHTGKKASLISGKILPQLAAWKAAPRKKPLLDLFLLDLWLRANGGSLRSAAVRLMKKYGLKHKPYRSGAALAREAEASCGAPLPAQLRKTLLTRHIPDYAAALKAYPGWNNRDFNPLR